MIQDLTMNLNEQDICCFPIFAWAETLAIIDSEFTGFLKTNENVTI